MNPWAVLGLKPGAERTDIRRAYARLLKTTNPEDDPEGFMALRAAHDAALDQLQWRRQWDDDGVDGGVDGGDSEDAADDGADDGADAAELPSGAPSQTPPQPAPELAPNPEFAAEREDLLVRQEAVIAAIAAGADGQRAPFITGLLISGVAVWQARRRGISGWPLRIFLIAIGLFFMLRPLVDERPATVRSPRPSAEMPVAIGDSADWVSAGDMLKSALPGTYRFLVALDIGANGRVRVCRLEQGTGLVRLDQSLCEQLTAKARYRPAKSGIGLPEAATLQLRGGWTVKALRLGDLPPPQTPLQTPPQIRPQTQLPPAATPTPRREPVIRCPDARVSGPMVAEPCMRSAWFGEGDYPAGPLARDESGRVGYRLAVDTTGRVERCDATQSSGHSQLDRETCAILIRRARFVPAQDVDGSPMTQDYASAIDWQLATR